MTKSFVPKSRPTGKVPPQAVASRETIESRLTAASDAAEASLKVCYIYERSRWETLRAGHPVRYRAPKSYDGTGGVTVDGELVLQKPKVSVWRSLLLWCQERNIPAEAYLQLQFECLDIQAGRPHEPLQLKAEGCLQLWLKYSPKLNERCRTALRVQQQILSQALQLELSFGTPHEDACILASTRSDLDLSPLFRYCYAAKFGTPRLLQVAENCEADAVLQYHRNKARYDDVWQNVLPEGFAALAAKRHTRYLVEHLSRLESH